MADDDKAAIERRIVAPLQLLVTAKKFSLATSHLLIAIAENKVTPEEAFNRMNDILDIVVEQTQVERRRMTHMLVRWHKDPTLMTGVTTHDEDEQARIWRTRRLTKDRETRRAEHKAWLQSRKEQNNGV